ncbi:MAG TPA: alpha/beta hydrolase [Anaerolineales bacterium]|nr:alpha/beta hydrolase [Anaerolineales bacterium]
MESVVSNDGTRIAYYRGGRGAPLVLIHGTGGANPAVGWTSVVPLLEQQFSVYAVDRRGRGNSGDNPNYAVEREYEDVAAVVDSIGEPANLLGHSYGGLCALEASLLSGNVRKLILYEPALNLSPPASAEPDQIGAEIQGLLEEGKREEAVVLFYSQIAMMQPEEIEQLRMSSSWAGRLASAHTLSREMRAHDQYAFVPERFRSMKIPTLLLVGGNSSASILGGANSLASVLQNCRVHVLPGQQHVAMLTAPEMFVDAVARFMLESI